MTVELVTGYAGVAHISSEDDGSRNAGTFGPGRYVLDTGAKFACQMTDNYKYSIGTGDALFDGRHVRVSAAENMTLDNGASGMNRIDVICIKYERNTSTGVEQCSLAIVKGTSTAGTPTSPTIPSGSILDGVDTAYMPLWSIAITGVSSSATPTKLFGDLLPSNAALAETLDTKVFADAQIGSVAASKVTGALGVAHGGTGKTSLDSNAVLTGNGTSAVKPVATGNGALYATSANGAAQFGTLPIGQGGTGVTSNPSMLTNLGSTSAAGVFAASPRPGVTGTLGAANGGTGQTSLKAARNAMGLGNTTGALPVANGGTGATTAADARSNLGVGTIGTKNSLAASDIPSLAISKITNLQSTLDGKAASTHYHNVVNYPASASSLVKMYLTDAKNVRVDSRATASDSFAFYGYAAMSSQAPSDGGYKTANRVFATPNGSSGMPSIRALVPADIPSLAISKITNLQSSLDGKAQKPVQLYNNTSGGWHPTSGASPSLSLSVSNISSYRFLRIYFTTNDAANSSSGTTRGNNSVVVDTSTNKWFTMMSGHIVSGGTRLQVRMATAQVTSTGITVQRFVSSQDGTCLYFNMPANEIGMDDKIYIYRIEGWN